jgi:hypothetical protein
MYGRQRIIYARLFFILLLVGSERNAACQEVPRPHEPPHESDHPPDPRGTGHRDPDIFHPDPSPRPWEVHKWLHQESIPRTNIRTNTGDQLFKIKAAEKWSIAVPLKDGSLKTKGQILEAII